jgi:ribosomal protein S12 methylthiotransferase
MSTKRNKSCVTVGFVALGCPKNMVDSERILAQIARAGLIITQDADNADVVIINTCGFISPAKDEALDAIRKAVRQKQKGRVRKVIVAGCLPQRLGKALLEQTPGIDAIVGLEHRDNIVEVIKKTLLNDSLVQLVKPARRPGPPANYAPALLIPANKRGLLTKMRILHNPRYQG